MGLSQHHLMHPWPSWDLARLLLVAPVASRQVLCASAVIEGGGGGRAGTESVQAVCSGSHRASASLPAQTHDPVPGFSRLPLWSKAGKSLGPRFPRARGGAGPWKPRLGLPRPVLTGSPRWQRAGPAQSSCRPHRTQDRAVWKWALRIPCFGVRGRGRDREEQNWIQPSHGGCCPCVCAHMCARCVRAGGPFHFDAPNSSASFLCQMFALVFADLLPRHAGEAVQVQSLRRPWCLRSRSRRFQLALCRHPAKGSRGPGSPGAPS